MKCLATQGMIGLASAVGFLAGLAGFSGLASAEISVQGDKIIRQRPAGIGGVVVNAHGEEFATNGGGIDFQGDLKAARIGLVRKSAYPDPRNPDRPLAYYDTAVRAILKAGATPLFIQFITPPGTVDWHLRKTPGSTPPRYYTATGEFEGGTPASNMAWLVKHYAAAPFNIGTQYWEVGNEPDHAIDFGVKSGAEYAMIFNGCDAALKAAGVRDGVVLCGPVSINNYNWPNRGGLSTDLMDTFLDRCKDSVDIVTLHSYAGSKDLLGVLQAPHKLEFLFDAGRKIGPKDDYGLASLQAKMDGIRFGRGNVGVGVTEHNTQAENVARGLWNLAATQYLLLNPRGMLDTAFVYDDFGKQQGGFGFYNEQKQRGYAYWAAWINGNLRGGQILARQIAPNADKSSLMKDGRSYLLALATRDDKALYVEVINRSDKPIKDQVGIQGVWIAADAKVFTLADEVTPEKGKPMKVGAMFEYEFPAASATVFRIPVRP